MLSRDAIIRQMLLFMRADGQTVGSLAAHLTVPLVVMRRLAGGDTHVPFEEFRKVRVWVEKRAASPAARKPKPAPAVALLAAPAPSPELPRANRGRQRNLALVDRDVDTLRRRIGSLEGLIEHQGKQIEHLIARLKGEPACQASTASSRISPLASL